MGRLAQFDGTFGLGPQSTAAGELAGPEEDPLAADVPVLRSVFRTDNASVCPLPLVFGLGPVSRVGEVGDRYTVFFA